MSKEFVNWDQITIKSGATADPAAGAQLASITVPAGKRWKFVSLEATLVTDATVATRYFLVTYYMDGTNITYQTLAGVNITASLTRVQSYVTGSFVTTAGTEYGQHLPDIELPAGATITMVAIALVAGDNISAATYYYKEASV